MPVVITPCYYGNVRGRGPRLASEEDPGQSRLSRIIRTDDKAPAALRPCPGPRQTRGLSCTSKAHILFAPVDLRRIVCPAAAESADFIELAIQD